MPLRVGIDISLVRDYKIRGTPGPEVWSVFAPEGQLLGTLETPERLQVRQIGCRLHARTAERRPPPNDGGGRFVEPPSRYV